MIWVSGQAWVPNWWDFCVLFCGQVGYIQLGSEQLLIQPVNASETSFSGKEHFIRRRRSTNAGHPTKPHGPEEHCKVVAGELGVAPASSHGNCVWILWFLWLGSWSWGRMEGVSESCCCFRQESHHRHEVVGYVLSHWTCEMINFALTLQCDHCKGRTHCIFSKVSVDGSSSISPFHWSCAEQAGIEWWSSHFRVENIPSATLI